MLKKLLTTDPRKRITIKQITQHPWFQSDNPMVSYGLLVNNYVIPVEDNILELMAEYGFDKEEVTKAVTNNKHNHITTTYFILLQKLVKQGFTCRSDLYSKVFVDYIKDKRNLRNFVQLSTEVEKKEEPIVVQRITTEPAKEVSKLNGRLESKKTNFFSTSISFEREKRSISKDIPKKKSIDRKVLKTTGFEAIKEELHKKRKKLAGKVDKDNVLSRLLTIGSVKDKKHRKRQSDGNIMAVLPTEMINLSVGIKHKRMQSIQAEFSKTLETRGSKLAKLFGKRDKSLKLSEFPRLCKEVIDLTAIFTNELDCLVSDLKKLLHSNKIIYKTDLVKQ